MIRAVVTSHLLLLFLFSLSAHSFEVCRDTLYVQVKFRQGYSSVDTSFCDNKSHLEHLISLLANVTSDSLGAVKSITVKGCASPEGYTPRNRILSEKRAQNLRTYILNKIPLTDSLVKIAPSDVDWELLSRMIAATDQSWRDEAVHIIANTPIWIFDKDKRIIDGRKNRLCMLQGGRAWRYMKKNFFPDLRNAGFRIICERELLVAAPGEAVENVDVPDETVLVNVDSTVDTPPVVVDTQVEDTIAPAPILQMEKDRTFAVLLKTNMLYSVAAIPTIGLEVSIGKKWSMSAQWMYAWWNNDARHRYWRVNGGDMEVRRWFSPRREVRSMMCGHHIGLYGQILTYDIEWGGRGYLGERWSWGAGLSYGYSLPVGRQLNIDFTLGVGYLTGDYMKYIPQDDCYVWESTHRRNWFGPTKAEVSLVWYVGGRSERKGGAQ